MLQLFQLVVITYLLLACVTASGHLSRHHNVADTVSIVSN